MTRTVVYEQPLNERIRTFLRLEFLFRQAAHTLGGTSEWDTRSSISSLLAILEILSRADIKTELLKELERQQTSLGRWRHQPAVDLQHLDGLLDKLAAYQERLHGNTAQLGHALRDTELLSGLRQRQTTPGGTCEFDLPVYHHWLQQPAMERNAIVLDWYSQLEDVRGPVALVLDLVRQSTKPSRQRAERGFYQSALDTTQPYQMLRVLLPSDAQFFAEISAGRHRFTVRFLQPQANARPVQISEDTDFLLACCAL